VQTHVQPVKQEPVQKYTDETADHGRDRSQMRLAPCYEEGLEHDARQVFTAIIINRSGYPRLFSSGEMENTYTVGLAVTGYHWIQNHTSAQSTFYATRRLDTFPLKP